MSTPIDLTWSYLAGSLIVFTCAAALRRFGLNDLAFLVTWGMVITLLVRLALLVSDLKQLRAVVGDDGGNLVLVQRRLLPRRRSSIENSSATGEPWTVEFLLTHALAADRETFRGVFTPGNSVTELHIRCVTDRCRTFRITSVWVSRYRAILQWYDCTNSQRLLGSNLFSQLQVSPLPEEMVEKSRESMNKLAEIIGVDGVAVVTIGKNPAGERLTMRGASTNLPTDVLYELEREPLLASMPVVDAARRQRRVNATTPPDVVSDEMLVHEGRFWCIASESTDLVLIVVDETHRRPSTIEVYDCDIVIQRIEASLVGWWALEEAEAASRRWKRRFTFSPTPTAIMNATGLVMESNKAFVELFPGTDFSSRVTWEELTGLPMRREDADGALRRRACLGLGGEVRYLDVAVGKLDRGLLLMEAREVTEEVANAVEASRLGIRMHNLAGSTRRSLEARQRQVGELLESGLKPMVAKAKNNALALAQGHERRLQIDTVFAELDEILSSAIDANGNATLSDGLRGQLENLTQYLALFGIDTEVSHDEVHIPEQIEVIVRRVLNEAIANVVAGTGAHHCAVSVTVGEDEVIVEVVDDGVMAVTDGRYGFKLISRIAEAVGGRVEVYGLPGYGTRLSAHLPLGGWQPSRQLEMGL